jgi:hypothetical protein
MKWKVPNRRTCFNLISAILLVLGLGSATLIYQGAGNYADDVLGYEEASGTPYPIRPEDSKAYLRGLELFGGKANVLADKLRRSLLGLWHGKSLAVIVGLSTIIISFGFFYAANRLPERLKSDAQSEDSRNGTK